MPEYSEESSNADFPVSIDLGKSPNVDSPITPSSDKGEKNKKYYPTLYISDVDGIDKLPEEGCALIKFKRNSVTVRKGSDGKSTASADLEIQSICLPSDGADSSDDDDDEDTGNLIDSMAKKAGVKTDDSDDEEMA